MKSNHIKPQPVNTGRSVYSDFYGRTLPAKKHQVNSVLEIGFDMDSLKALSKIFPNALIHTLDVFNGRSVSKDDVLDAGFFAYAIDEKENGKQGLSLTSILTKFDIIIDRRTLFGFSDILVFKILYTNNLNDHGLYYLEDLHLGPMTNKPPEANETCLSAVKALFDANRSFSNQYLRKEAISALIDLTEWCDMSPDEKIAVFKKRKTAERKKKVRMVAKPETNTPAAAVKQPTTSTEQPVNTTPAAENTPEPEFVLPPKITVQFFGKDPITINNPSKFGPVRKDIFASFFGKVSEAPALYEMYRSDSDFFFADIPQGSDRYRLEMARSFFTICNNDQSIIDAILNDTIPVVIMASETYTDRYNNGEHPFMIVCKSTDIQLVTGQIYRDSSLMAKYIINGKNLLKKIAS